MTTFLRMTLSFLAAGIIFLELPAQDNTEEGQLAVRAMNESINLSWDMPYREGECILQMSQLYNRTLLPFEDIDPTAHDVSGQFNFSFQPKYSGIYVFRVKYVSQGGRVSYSRLREINFGNGNYHTMCTFPDSSLAVAPIFINFRQNEQVQISVESVDGTHSQDLYTGTVSPQKPLELSLPSKDLRKGMYFLQIASEQSSARHQIWVY